tara:strand:- start:43 stop:2589 length:2547 start_codon:yes stop_codon:yes gene_type:complete
MKKFNIIKKSRKKSKGIDEKIEYLNKECQKTGLNEIMTTTGMYQGSKKVPNQNVADFQALNVNGFGLGLSPADGNGLGGAYIGTIESGMSGAGGNEIGMPGVAISPPHPVTGERRVATTRTGMVDYSPARPGVDQTGNGYPTGSIAWVWDPNHPQFGPNGIWRQLQTHPSSGAWSFWDTGFLGFGFLNQNLSQMEFSDGSNLSSDVINVLQPLGVIAMQQGGIGEPRTTVLVQNNLDDPSFIPIDIGGLSSQGYDYLKNKAGVDISSNYYSPEDKKNVINYYKKLQLNPNYQPKPYEKESLIKQMRAQGDGTQIASTDLSTAFPPSPPDKEPVDPPPETPDEPPAPPESNPYPDEKADPAGLDARALKLGYNDPYYPVNPTGHYIAMVTTAQDILSAEMEAEFYSAAARGESPNYDTASINQAKEKVKNARANLDNWERWKKENNYIWKGPIDHAAEDQRRQAELEKQQKYETEKEKLEKAKEQAEADAEMHAAEAKKLLAEFGADVFLTLFGPGALKLAGKALGKLPAISKFFKLGKAAQKAQIDDALRAAKAAKVPKIMKAGKNLSADDVLDGFKNVDQNLYNLFKRNGPLSTSIDPIAGNMNKPGTVIRGRTGDILRIFDHKSGKFIKPDPIRLGASLELNKEKLLSEAAKLGHFEPEVLTVDLEKLRKGIMPEFPKNPPPKMINGYSEKSKLRPKTIEGTPFINVTKKDLAKNHIFKDSEIERYMNEINMINDYIKKHPEELIHAMQRYPKDDPRLAQLNFKMDQMKAASDEYMDTHFPENQKLFNKLQDKIIRNVKQTDPKNFTGHKDVPKFVEEKTEVIEKRKRIVSKHFNKSVKIKKPFKY